MNALWNELHQVIKPCVGCQRSLHDIRRYEIYASVEIYLLLEKQLLFAEKRSQQCYLDEEHPLRTNRRLEQSLQQLVKKSRELWSVNHNPTLRLEPYTGSELELKWLWTKIYQVYLDKTEITTAELRRVDQLVDRLEFMETPLEVLRFVSQASTLLRLASIPDTVEILDSAVSGWLLETDEVNEF